MALAIGLVHGVANRSAEGVAIGIILEKLLIKSILGSFL